MRLYHFLPLEWGLDDIRNCRVKVAKLDELNDPFEMMSVGTKDAILRKALDITKRHLAQNTGILCFSRSWRNPVQWSHYADRHRGICLGFDVPDAQTRPITYSRRRLTDVGFSGEEGEEAEKFMMRVLTTKFCHWRYEDEVRCFIRIDDKNLHDPMWFAAFQPNLVLREVIVGANCSLCRSDLAEALGDMRDAVHAMKARLAFGTFSVVRQRKNEFWR